MQKKEIFLITVYLIGAAVDAAVAVPMFGAPFSRQFDYEASYTMAAGAVMMVSWAVLLVWAACKPLERRALLLITLVPITGMFISNCMLSTQVIYPSGMFIFRLTGNILLASLYIFTYVFTRPRKSGI
ncbi:MAG: hypothetical protein JXA01_00400 [Dehalococcoidia bacterium]|nr:hypothetical protein [Dehalococcoidia bacterium]